MKLRETLINHNSNKLTNRHYCWMKILDQPQVDTSFFKLMMKIQMIEFGTN